MTAPSTETPGLEVSALLASAGFAHAFFTRRGGVSVGPFDSLSFSVAAGDDPAHVRENRRRAAATLGVRERGLLYVSQVHGADVAELDASVDPDAALSWIGDVTTGADPRVAYGVRTADCVPVLLADPETGRVAAVHSGWKGTLLDVTGAAIRHLAARGARPEALVAAVGPHIERCCFEVGEDVAADLASASALGRSVVGAGPSLSGRAPGPTLRVDLRAIVGEQLRRSGVVSERTEHVRGCTYCDTSRFFSYRRDGKRSGRLLSAIVPASSLAPAED